MLVCMGGGGVGVTVELVSSVFTMYCTVHGSLIIYLHKLSTPYNKRSKMSFILVFVEKKLLRRKSKDLFHYITS
jgi:hypothetical protein